MARKTRWLTAILLGLATAGCGGPYSSPQATFQTYRDAVARKDWKTSLGCLTAESQDKLVASLVAMVATASIMNKEAAALLEKHGVDRAQLAGDLLAGALANLASPREAIGEGTRQCVEAIADKPVFFADAATWLEQNNQRVADNLVLAAGAQLTDVQVNGDTATGKLSVPASGGSTSVRFKKINGRWLIDF